MGPRGVRGGRGRCPPWMKPGRMREGWTKHRRSLCGSCFSEQPDHRGTKIQAQRVGRGPQNGLFQPTLPVTEPEASGLRTALLALAQGWPYLPEVAGLPESWEVLGGQGQCRWAPQGWVRRPHVWEQRIWNGGLAD